MKSLSLDTQVRTVSGKKLEALRKAGMIPAVLYGPGAKNISLQLDARQLEKTYRQAGENTLIKLKIQDDKTPERNVLIYDVDHDPISQKIIHVDFLQVRMDQAIKASVPLVFTGEALAVKGGGGVLVKNIHEVEIEALPADLPHDIAVDISSLNTFEDAIFVKDLPVSSKVKILADPGLMVAQVQPPRTEAEMKALEEEVTEKVEEVKVETEEKKVEKAKGEEEE